MTLEAIAVGTGIAPIILTKDGQAVPTTLVPFGTGAVDEVTGESPIVIAGDVATPIVTITPATDVAAGSMSAADKAKLDAITLPLVESVTGTAPIVIGGTAANPVVTYAPPSGASFISVANGAALTAFDNTGLAVGAMAFVATYGAYWALLSGAVTSTDLAVERPAHAGSFHWARSLSAVSTDAQAQAAWSVDAVAGNDEASGAAGFPVQHLAEIVRRYGTSSPSNLPGAVTITAVGDIPTSDPWPFANVDSAFGPITFVGALIQVGVATIGVFTAKNLATGAADTITASGQSGAFWTPFVGMLVHDTTANAWFRVAVDDGTATATITEPVGTGAQAPAFVAIANGDALVIYRTSNVFVVRGAGTVNFTTCTFSGSNSIFYFDGAIPINFDRCQFLASTSCAPGQLLGYQFGNCDFGPNTFYEGDGQFYSGMVRTIAEFDGATRGNCLLDGNVLLLSRCHVFGAGLLIGRAGFFGGVWFEADSQPSGVIELATQHYGTPIQWGTASFDVRDGTQMVVGGDTAVNAMRLTGGYTIDGQATAFPYVGATPGAAVAVTPALLDANANLQRPATGSRIFIRV